LNVYTPRKAILSDGRLPVMQWFYGGAYVLGDGYEHGFYDGSVLAGRHDVVVVTSNYRLNVLGFNTYTKGPDGQTGTQAMEDQRLAMRWTQKNIGALGGDPDKVTLFGESAGAFSVMYHLVSPPSWPLFSKAIMQSGTSAVSWFFQPGDLAAEMHQGWATALGCSIGPQQLACLQAQNATDFVDEPANFTGRSPLYKLFPSGPAIDGTEHGLLDMPASLVNAGKFHQVPLLLGSNRNGGSMFEPITGIAIPGFPFEAKNEHDVDTLLNWTFPEDAARIKAAYPVSEFRFKSANAYQKIIEEALRDTVFMCSSRRLADKWAASGLDTYLYTFSFDLGPVAKISRLGDMHAFDIPFVFRQFLGPFKIISLSGNVEAMADVMSCQWTSFAHSGNPNGGSNVSAWPPNCEKVHGKVSAWPNFRDERSFYSLDYAGFPHFARPNPKPLRADNKYPDDEFVSDSKCSMWDTVSFPWRPKATSSDVLLLV